MRFASVADVKAKFSGYLKAGEEGPVIVTRNGRPVAVILSWTTKTRSSGLSWRTRQSFAPSLRRPSSRFAPAKGFRIVTSGLRRKRAPAGEKPPMPLAASFRSAGHGTPTIRRTLRTYLCGSLYLFHSRRAVRLA